MGNAVLMAGGAGTAAAQGAEVPRLFAPYGAGDAARLAADPAQARDWLGWTARGSSMATSVRSALARHS